MRSKLAVGSALFALLQSKITHFRMSSPTPCTNVPHSIKFTCNIPTHFVSTYSSSKKELFEKIKTLLYDATKAEFLLPTEEITNEEIKKNVAKSLIAAEHEFKKLVSAELVELFKPYNPMDAAITPLHQVHKNSKTQELQPLLHMAIQGSHVNIVKYLLDKCKVDPMRQYTFSYTSGRSHTTIVNTDALCYAIAIIAEKISSFTYEMLHEYNLQAAVPQANTSTTPWSSKSHASYPYIQPNWEALKFFNDNDADGLIEHILKPQLERHLQIFDMLLLKLQAASCLDKYDYLNHNCGAYYYFQLDDDDSDICTEKTKYKLNYLQYAAMVNNPIACARLIQAGANPNEPILEVDSDKQYVVASDTASTIAKRPEQYNKVINAIAKYQAQEVRYMGNNMLLKQSVTMLSDMVIINLNKE